MTARFEFKKEDCWIGVSWKRSTYIQHPNHGAVDAFVSVLDVWIGLLPLVPLHLTFKRRMGER